MTANYTLCEMELSPKKIRQCNSLLKPWVFCLIEEEEEEEENKIDWKAVARLKVSTNIHKYAD